MGVKIAYPGKEYIRIKQENLAEIQRFLSLERRHLIHLDFYPTEDSLELVFSYFPDTKRFIVSNHIREFNSFFRSRRDKKYYVENTGDSLVSFFRKNNKVLVNFNTLSIASIMSLTQRGVFEDMLRNVEVIKMDDLLFERLWDRVKD